MSKYDFIIYGNNIATIVAALELAKINKKVALINPSKNWGAHFAGIKINNINFDIGMNYFEFTTFQNASDLIMSYNPIVRNDSARFFHLIEKYICDRIELVEVEKIELLLNGTFSKDLIIANNICELANLTSEQINKIKSELESILEGSDKRLHGSQKKLNEDLFLSTSFYDVSVANHGSTFHEVFIEPFCRKIFNFSTKELPALLHRMAWLPLYYPESLLEAITKSKKFSNTIFHYPKQGYFSLFIELLLEEINLNQNITIFTEDLIKIDKQTTFNLTLERKSIQSDHLIWSSNLEKLIELQTLEQYDKTSFQKASLSILFCLIDRQNIDRQFSCLYVSESSPIYRITNQEFSAKNYNSNTLRLIIEFNTDVLNNTGLEYDEKVLDHVNDFLIKHKIIKTPILRNSAHMKTFKNVVNLPNFDNFNTYNKLLESTHRNLPEIDFIGPASGFYSSSFNDQITQALRLGFKYKN